MMGTEIWCSMEQGLASCWYGSCWVIFVITTSYVLQNYRYLFILITRQLKNFNLTLAFAQIPCICFSFCSNYFFLKSSCCNPTIKILYVNICQSNRDMAYFWNMNIANRSMMKNSCDVTKTFLSKSMHYIIPCISHVGTYYERDWIYLIPDQNWNWNLFSDFKTNVLELIRKCAT